MVLNDMGKDVKNMCWDSGSKQYELAKAVGTTDQYVSRLLRNKGLVNKMFVAIVESLGYDIQLTYVKRENS